MKPDAVRFLFQFFGFSADFFPFFLGVFFFFFLELSSGKFESRGKQCDIRWSSFIPDGVGGRKRRPIYTVVQINNTFRIPGEKPHSDIQAAFDRPQAVFQYYDGLTGDLLYAESIIPAR